jgi:hypothetical protein
VGLSQTLLPQPCDFRQLWFEHNVSESYNIYTLTSVGEMQSSSSSSSMALRPVFGPWPPQTSASSKASVEVSRQIQELLFVNEGGTYNY